MRRAAIALAVVAGIAATKVSVDPLRRPPPDLERELLQAEQRSEDAAAAAFLSQQALRAARPGLEHDRARDRAMQDRLRESWAAAREWKVRGAIMRLEGQ